MRGHQLAIWVIGFFGTVACAQPILGVTWDGFVVELDAQTGAVSNTRASTINRMNSLAQLPDGRLATISGGFIDSMTQLPNRLAFIDPITGAESLGPLLDLQRPTSFRALAVSGDTWLAVADSGSIGSEDRLVQIDPLTGDTTDLGGLGFAGVQSLAFSSNGTLFAWDGTGSAASGGVRQGAGLLMVDPMTGAATDVFVDDIGLSLQSFAFGPGDSIFGATAGVLPGGGMANSLYQIDAQTGDSTLIGSYDPQYDIRGISVVPSLGTGVYISTFAVASGLVTRRRRGR